MEKCELQVRHSWEELLREAVSKPGILHEAYSRFWNYSLGNQVLAILQCHGRGINAGPLASFKRWRELGRHVKKGEKALTLCMPMQLKCREWDERRHEAGMDENAKPEVLGSRTIFVYKRNWFVLSQTEGRKYEPEPVPSWDKKMALATLGIMEVQFTITDGNCQGYATRNRTISVSPIAVLPHKTFFHEVAHIMLGHVDTGSMTDDERTPKALREVEAESVALICSASLGLPGADEARGYIQHWLVGEEIPERSSRCIFQAADLVLKAGIEPKI
jgi:antirestriction protein ArdC